MKINKNLNDDIEAKILNYLITIPLNNEHHKIFNYADPKWFINETYKEIFNTLLSIYNEYKCVDLTFIEKSLNEKKNGNYLYDVLLKKIIPLQTPYSDDINLYLSKIRENYINHSLKNTINQALKNLDDQSLTYENIIESLRNKFYELEDQRNIKDFHKIEDITQEIINKFLIKNKVSSNNVKSGFISLDKKLGGFQNGDLIILAARPSVGKTAFALNIAANVSNISNLNVAFFSLEMPAEQLVLRIIASFSGISSFKIKDNDFLTKEEKEIIWNIIQKINNWNLFIDDSGSIKLDEIIWKSKKLKEKNKLDLIIIDYLQLIPTSSFSGAENRQFEVSKISRSLKQLARELEVPIIALSQLNRRIETREDKRPIMSDLRESGAIEQDADIIAFLYREDYYKKEDEKNPNEIQITNLIISKHRNGATGTIDFYFDQKSGRFIDVEK